MEIRPLCDTDRTAAQAFAARLAQRPDLAFEIPDARLQQPGSQPSQMETIVAVDESGIHGGYGLRSDPFSIDGQDETLHYFKYPVSEGVIDRRYATVGLQLQFDIEKRQPFIYGLGGGGINSQVNQLKIRAGWSAGDLPLFLYVNNPARFLRHAPALQRTTARRLAGSGLVWSGLGTGALNLVNYWRSRSARQAKLGGCFEITGEFPTWVDDLYSDCRTQYRLIARRDRSMLDWRFPPDTPDLTRGIVSRGSNSIGWFVTVDHVRNKADHLGDLKVGMIADFLGEPDDALHIVRAATDHLRSLGVDLIVCNAGHHAWRQALLKNGYLIGPTNYPFLGSPKLIERLQPFPDFLKQSHFTRGDGDGVLAFVQQSGTRVEETNTTPNIESTVNTARPELERRIDTPRPIHEGPPPLACEASPRFTPTEPPLVVPHRTESSRSA